MKTWGFFLLVATSGCSATSPISAERDPGTAAGSGGASSAASGVGPGGPSTGAGAGDSLYQSGSRLRAKYLLGADGSKQFTGWHDSKLNVDCAPQLAAGNLLRCLPANTPTYLWADSSCKTSPVAMGQCVEYLGSLPTTQGCSGNPVRIFKAGNALAETTVVYQGTPSGCVKIGALNQPLTAAGAEIDPSTFEEMTELVE